MLPALPLTIQPCFTCLPWQHVQDISHRNTPALEASLPNGHPPSNGQSHPASSNTRAASNPAQQPLALDNGHLAPAPHRARDASSADSSHQAPESSSANHTLPNGHISRPAPASALQDKALPVLLLPENRRSHGLEEFLARIPAEARTAYEEAIVAARGQISAADRQQLWKQRFPVWPAHRPLWPKAPIHWIEEHWSLLHAKGCLHAGSPQCAIRAGMILNQDIWISTHLHWGPVNSAANVLSWSMLP